LTLLWLLAEAAGALLMVVAAALALCVIFLANL
jgi:hypothetical protein